MSKTSRWLTAEIDRWTQERIITPDQGAQIRSLYPAEPVQSVSWGLIVFSGLGAVVLGLGVILLLAYNWESIPKFGKLGLIFAATASAHGCGLHLRRTPGWNSTLADVCFLLGSMFYGAGIWLVAQVYHIQEHFPNGFLFWGLGALALAWALQSIPQALLATVVLAIWGVSEATAFGSPVDYAALLILFGVGPLVWRRSSALLGAVVLAAIYSVALPSAGSRGGAGAVFSTALALSVILIGLPKLSFADGLSTALKRVLMIFGWIGFLICSYVLSFSGIADDVLRWSYHQDDFGYLVYRWIVTLAALLVWALVLVRWRRGAFARFRFEEWLCPIALVYCHLMALPSTVMGGEFVSAVFNLICLGIATAWMVRGCREGRLSRVVCGSLVLVFLVFARYFDLFDSLAMRGLAFVVLGAVLFAEGFFYRRSRSEADRGGMPS